MDNKINGRTPEEIKQGLEVCIGISDLSKGYCDRCPYIPDASCRDTLEIDALAYIQQLEEDKKRLQERICNQRRQLRVLHAMYEWALGRLQKAKLNDRANFQHWLWEKGYDLKTIELPESRYQQLEAERDELLQKNQQLERERDESRNGLDTINYANTELHSAYEATQRAY